MHFHDKNAEFHLFFLIVIDFLSTDLHPNPRGRVQVMI